MPGDLSLKAMTSHIKRELMEFDYIQRGDKNARALHIIRVLSYIDVYFVHIHKNFPLKFINTVYAKVKSYLSENYEGVEKEYEDKLVELSKSLKCKIEPLFGY